MQEDGLSILAKGLGLENVFLYVVKVHSDPANLVPYVPYEYTPESTRELSRAQECKFQGLLWTDIVRNYPEFVLKPR